MTALYDRVRTLSRALYAEPAKLGAVADALYNHVLDSIDLDALSRLDQMLWSVLDAAGIDDEDGELSSRLMRDAIIRLAHGGDRFVSHVPFGISKAEAKAAAFDDGCPFCVLDAAQPPPPPPDSSDHVEGECACCDMMASEWRAQNADALARAGLGSRIPARSTPS